MQHSLSSEDPLPLRRELARSPQISRQSYTAVVRMYARYCTARYRSPPQRSGCSRVGRLVSQARGSLASFEESDNGPERKDNGMIVSLSLHLTKRNMRNNDHSLVLSLCHTPRSLPILTEVVAIVDVVCTSCTYFTSRPDLHRHSGHRAA